jgi:hypothetical protein
MTERRRFPRQAVDVFLNKFIGGYPHLCRVIDISPRGIQIARHREPVTHMQSFQLELRLPGDSHTLWLWARSVSERGRRQVLEFVSPSPEDAHRIERFVETYQPA